MGPSKDMVLGIYYLTMDPTVELVSRKNNADDFRSMETVINNKKVKVGIAFRSNGYYFAQFRNIPGAVLYNDVTEEDENGRPRTIETAIDRTFRALDEGEVDVMIANGYEMKKLIEQNGWEDKFEITNLHERRLVVDMDEIEYLYRLGKVQLHNTYSSG